MMLLNLNSDISHGDTSSIDTSSIRADGASSGFECIRVSSRGELASRLLAFSCYRLSSSARGGDAIVGSAAGFRRGEAR